MGPRHAHSAPNEREEAANMNAKQGAEGELAVAGVTGRPHFRRRSR
jgi:hypothetical protein